ncbi:Cytosolic phospholipase A2 delta [Paramyrothecium foliicola]|nr:Cytosolic phospholipase A2 delta [Paramyrothecium foliicola]
MRHRIIRTASLAKLRPPSSRSHRFARYQKQLRQSFFTGTKSPPPRQTSRSTIPLAIVTGGLFIWWLYPSEDFERLSSKNKKIETRLRFEAQQDAVGDEEDEFDENSTWAQLVRRFQLSSLATDIQWTALPDKLVDTILPDWTKLIPGYVKKLQRELSMAPGSLADEIWSEAHDPLIHPEIRYTAQVRVSDDLCDEEKQFLARRRKYTRVALAKYLGINESDIHPDDIPTIAMCGSGGGLRALIAGTGSLIATDEDGLFDCVTYTSGVSGTCWLQALYFTSFNRGKLSSLLDHIKSRASVHIAYPPVAFQLLTSSPTSKPILSGLVEKLRGDKTADFGLVDVYGLLLAARFLVPRGELSVNERDFKLSNQSSFLKYGQHPLPIYTAVRHEIPLDTAGDVPESAQVEAARVEQESKKEAWFQWFEITPYEFFCEEFGAGVPTWALGRKFDNGRDVPPESGFHLPELRMPLMLAIFGSAFCATLSHYYREIRPMVRSISGLGAIDDLIHGRDDDLSKVHPIGPANIPNFAYQMHGKLAKSTPQSIYDNEYIQLMDAGMSNNLPIYPLLRPGRDVDVVIAFDASADIKTDNWLSVADGYARQRGIKGWPVGIGWPKPGESPSQVKRELIEAEADSVREAEQRVENAKKEQESRRQEAERASADFKSGEHGSKYDAGNDSAGDLGYCTVWLGTTQERSSEPPPPSKAITDSDSWKLMERDAGIAVVYLPFLQNDKVPDICPGSTDFLSTWNFIYTPEQIDQVVNLARANYDEGRDQIKSTVRAVYERKKQLREEAEKQRQRERFRKIATNHVEALLGNSDQFS